jgi:SAM-dependent methyltransferase
LRHRALAGNPARASEPAGQSRLMNADPNLDLYNRADVVAFYDRSAGLMPPEKHVFARYIPAGLDVLDIGVGGGRTTAFLAPTARRYFGVDYSEAMVAACAAKFPGYEFAQADATDLSFLPDASFDVALFSFNGIDCIPSDAGRIACLREMRRVVRPGGAVIISSHNAKVLGVYPQLSDVGPLKKLWRLARSVLVSARLSVRTLRSPAYRRGAGFITDPVHGGLFIHVSTPESIARDAAAAGLEIVEIVQGHHPKRLPEFLNPWNTFVMRPTIA